MQKIKDSEETDLAKTNQETNQETNPQKTTTNNALKKIVTYLSPSSVPWFVGQNVSTVPLSFLLFNRWYEDVLVAGYCRLSLPVPSFSNKL